MTPLVDSRAQNANDVGVHEETLAEGSGGKPVTDPGNDDADTVDATVLAAESERTRIHALAALFVSLALTTALLAWLNDGSLGARVLVAAYAANSAFAGVMWLIARRSGYGEWASAAVGVSVTLLAVGSCVVLGVDSVAVVALPPLVYYYGLGDSRFRRRAVIAAALAGYAAVSLLTVTGLVPPRGTAFQGKPELRDSRLTLLATSAGVIQIVSLTYFLARRTRRSTLDAMTKLERARRGIRQRDALLDEARQNFAELQRGARMGRHSGRQLGRFRVGEVLGRGAIGEVYAATEVESGRAVALKALHPHLETDTSHQLRFAREVRIVGELATPFVPEFVDSGVDDEGAPYFVMELLEGVDLANELRQRKRLELTELDELVEHVGAALVEAHGRGVVHRDIKPQNLFRVRSPEPMWKVLDFGVSKWITDTGTLTQGAAIGTPAYMSPEQIRGREVDARADVFAFGAVLYRALTGRPAFSAPSELLTLLSVSATQPARPSDHARVDEDLEAVLALALAKRPDQRFSSVERLVTAWRQARTSGLAPETREAARRLLAEAPWGADVELDAPAEPRENAL
ncbi:MAG: serine/threonine-protein kinase [Polyangiaceae bacterium]